LRASADGADSSERVLPDGCCELIINRGDRYQQVLGEGQRLLQPAWMLVGQITHHLEIEATGATDLIGVRFEPAGLFPFVGITMNEMTERRVALDDVCRRLRGSLERALPASSDGTAVSMRIFAVLSSFLGSTTNQSTRVRAAVEHMTRSDGQARIATICGDLRITARTLERDFRLQVGVTPKQLARILRFQRVINVVSDQDAPQWGEVALDCGYYDQAHLIRDFRAHSGQSPQRYLAEENQLTKLFTGQADA
jgi:AraC-like DNA-binding protein